MKKTTTPQKVKTVTIGRNKAIELIENSGGRFMTLTCDTKDTKNRKMNCVYVNTMKTGHARVKEIGKGYKGVNFQTLSEVKLDKQVYKVK